MNFVVANKGEYVNLDQVMYIEIHQTKVGPTESFELWAHSVGPASYGSGGYLSVLASGLPTRDAAIAELRQLLRGERSIV